MEYKRIRLIARKGLDEILFNLECRQREALEKYLIKYLSLLHKQEFERKVKEERSLR